MSRIILATFAFILTFVIPSCGIFSSKTVKYPENYEAQIDVIYTTVDTWDGRIDLYTNPTSIEPTPVVLNIHGGGWNHGTKESRTGFGSFFENGYAVANVEYRLAHEGKAPAAIEDIRCALIYLVNNARQLNINPDKIVIMGASAGGHLALMAGLTANSKLFDKNCEYGGKIKIFAIIDKYGPTDLMPAIQNSSVKKWLGEKTSNPDFVKSISPVNYVTSDSPPVFIVHGTEDPLVPYRQSVILYEKLKTNKIKCEMITVEGGKHGKFSKEENIDIKQKMWEFLHNLK